MISRGVRQPTAKYRRDRYSSCPNARTQRIRRRSAGKRFAFSSPAVMSATAPSSQPSVWATTSGSFMAWYEVSR